MVYSLAGHELETPLISAAGLINGSEENRIIEDVKTLAATAIGALTVGSWTIPKRLGNAAEFGEPTYHFDFETGTMGNSLGLPNIGIKSGENLVSEIIDIARNKPVKFSASPVIAEGNIGTSVEQSVEMATRLFNAGAKIVEINVSCPNVVTNSGGRKPIMGHDVQAMEDLMIALANSDIPISTRTAGLGIKMPPYLSIDEIRVQREVARIIKNAPLAFLITSNTIPGYRPVNSEGKPILTVPSGIGGKSGPATRMEGRLQLSTWKGLVGNNLPIVSALGVYDGEEVAIREELGAVASEMNTRLWNSTNWKATVSEVLAEYAQHQPE